MPSSRPWTLRENGVRLAVRLQPGAAREAVDGLHRADDGQVRLKVRVRAVAEKGRANAALEKLLARRLGIGVRAVRVVAGLRERNKLVALEGASGRLADAIAALIRESDGNARN